MDLLLAARRDVARTAPHESNVQSSCHPEVTKALGSSGGPFATDEILRLRAQNGTRFARRSSPSQRSRPEPAAREQDIEIAPIHCDVHDLVVWELGGDPRPRQAVIAGPPQTLPRQRDDNGAVACHP